MSSWINGLWYQFIQRFVQVSGVAFFGLRSRGQEKVPLTGPLIVVANHQSNGDPPLIGCIPERRFAYLAKKTLFKFPPHGLVHQLAPCDPDRPRRHGPWRVQGNAQAAQARRRGADFSRGTTLLGRRDLPADARLSWALSAAARRCYNRSASRACTKPGPAAQRCRSRAVSLSNTAMSSRATKSNGLTTRNCSHWSIAGFASAMRRQSSCGGKLSTPRPHPPPGMISSAPLWRFRRALHPSLRPFRSCRAVLAAPCLRRCNVVLRVCGGRA